MRIASHVEKVGRLVDLRKRLDPIEDFELWYWATLTASTNILNASLHATGLTSEERIFSTIPGVHVEPRLDGSFVRVLRGPGDVSHVGWPPVKGQRPEYLVRIEHEIEIIEKHRDPCVRADREPTAAIVEECDRAFSEAHRLYTDGIVGRSA